jgi:hypothetical protein
MLGIRNGTVGEKMGPSLNPCEVIFHRLHRILPHRIRPGKAHSSRLNRPCGGYLSPPPSTNLT